MKVFIYIIFFWGYSLLGIAQQNPQINKIDVKSYSFSLEIFDETDMIRGNAQVEIQILTECNLFYLELVEKKTSKGMTVDSVLINGIKSTFQHTNNRINIQHPYLSWEEGEKLTLLVFYHGIPEDGLIISNNIFGKRCFFGDNWPNRAQHYLPVVDHPSDKAKVEFKITAPEHYEVIASGKLQKTTGLKDHRSLHHFKSSFDFPTKVMVFAAADFKVTQYGDINGVPVSSWIYEENQKGENDYLYSIEALEFFSSKIGPYQYEKLANVQSTTRYGGMENAGNIFYMEHSVNGKASFENLIVHEVAHHWYGNAVSEINWNHIWLSEGFATYLTDLYIENKYGVKKFKENISIERDRVIKYNLNNSLPLIDSLGLNLNNLLNTNTYQKGAWVLHMLRQKTGDDIFFEILRDFYDTYKYGNASSKDFQYIAEKKSGMNLEQFFYQWLYIPGNPDIDIIWFFKDNVLYFKLEQNQKIGSFYTELELRINENLYLLKMDERTEYFSLPSLDNKPEINVDPNVKLLFKYNLRSRKFKLPDPAFLHNIDQDNICPITYNDRMYLQPGDLLFQDLDCGPLCNAIESVTSGYRGANFSHVGMISKVTKDSIMVFEAIGGRVKESRLIDFLQRSHDAYGNPKVMVGRVEKDKIGEEALQSISKYMGKEYDNEFDIENDSYYCSELLYFSFKENDLPIFSLYPMTFKSPNTGEYDPAWIDYYKSLQKDIPEGKPGLNPGGISRSPYVNMIFKFGVPDGYLK